MGVFSNAFEKKWFWIFMFMYVLIMIPFPFFFLHEVHSVNSRTSLVYRRLDPSYGSDNGSHLHFL